MHDLIVLCRQSEGLCRIPRICNGPQELPRRWWPRHRPIFALRVLYDLAVPLCPQLFHGESLGPPRANRNLCPGPIEVPIVVYTQADSLNTISVRVSFAGAFAQQFSQPVFVLAARKDAPRRSGNSGEQSYVSGRKNRLLHQKKQRQLCPHLPEWPPQRHEQCL